MARLSSDGPVVQACCPSCDASGSEELGVEDASHTLIIRDDAENATKFGSESASFPQQNSVRRSPRDDRRKFAARVGRKSPERPESQVDAFDPTQFAHSVSDLL